MSSARTFLLLAMVLSVKTLSAKHSVYHLSSARAEQPEQLLQARYRIRDNWSGFPRQDDLQRRYSFAGVPVTLTGMLLRWMLGSQNRLGKSSIL